MTLPFNPAALGREMSREDVRELQLRLAGFRGTVWDGYLGPLTERQVACFQRDVMGAAQPLGVVDADTVAAINAFADAHPIDFARLCCECGECSSFGQGRFRDVYRSGMSKDEAYHHREYPGIHKAILHSFRALVFYAAINGARTPYIECGYRCWVHNQIKERTSTNHMGKALDVNLALADGDSEEDKRRRCDALRAMLLTTSEFQIGWEQPNCKALEPSQIAPTWIHMDVRCYDAEYLASALFVRSSEELDA